MSTACVLLALNLGVQWLGVPRFQMIDANVQRRAKVGVECVYMYHVTGVIRYLRRLVSKVGTTLGALCSRSRSAVSPRLTPYQRLTMDGSW